MGCGYTLGRIVEVLPWKLVEMRLEGLQVAQEKVVRRAGQAKLAPCTTMSPEFDEEGY